MTTLAPALSARYLPRARPWLRDVTLVVAGSLFMAALAQVQIPLPFTPVPLTGQTFGVLLVAAALGSKRGPLAMLLYLFEGAMGLPFFAGASGGLHVLAGATAGYLAGFVVAALVIGLMAEHGLERSVRTSFLPFLAGTAMIYLFGVGWLALLLGSFEQAIVAGLLPFLAGDLIKLVLASAALPAAWRLVGRSMDR